MHLLGQNGVATAKVQYLELMRIGLEIIVYFLCLGSLVEWVFFFLLFSCVACLFVVRRLHVLIMSTWFLFKNLFLELLLRMLRNGELQRIFPTLLFTI